jgi:hypothetical protein
MLNNAGKIEVYILRTLLDFQEYVDPTRTVAHHRNST